MDDDTYPEIADSITANVNVDEAGEMATVGSFIDNVQVGFGGVRNDSITVSFPGFSLGGKYENLRVHLSAEMARELADALEAAAIETENE